MLKIEDKTLTTKQVYQLAYYQAHADKLREYQRLYRQKKTKSTSTKFHSFEQPRPPVLFELHIGHLQEATGDPFVKLVNAILAGERMLV
jgi:hypothetical protein